MARGSRSRMSDLRLDHGGMRSVLKSGEVQREIDELANGIAADVLPVLGPDAGEVVVDSGYQSSRASASVTIKDPRAKLWQARDGVLTRAAAQHGLELGGRAR
jgi:hypothetical protein